MKLLAVSDEELPTIYSPQIKQRFADMHLVVGCGDLQFYYLEFIVSMLNKPLYYVPGNHDARQQYLADGRTVTTAEGCLNIDDTVVFDPTHNLILAGLGGSIRYKPRSHNQYSQFDMWRRVLKLAPRLTLNRFVRGRALDMLLTHAPAAGVHDEPDGVHDGFEAFHWVMRWFRPRYLLHGHAHRYRRDKVMRTWVEQTEVVNVHPYYVINWQRQGRRVEVRRR